LQPLNIANILAINKLDGGAKPKAKNMKIIIFTIAFIILVYLSVFLLSLGGFIEKKSQKKTYFFLYEPANIVKIGFSKDVERRKKQIETQYNIKLTTLKILDYNAEKQMRILFRDEWLGNDFKYGIEWHNFSERIKIFIQL